MAATIIVGTNSWVTLAEADTYFESRAQSDSWTALSTDNKNIYLITAFNWIFYDPGFLAPASSTNQAVKNGQCEAALYLIDYGVEHEKREALLSMGVENFKYSKWSEKLGETKKPDSVTNYFNYAGFYVGANVLIQTTELDESSY